MWWIAIGVVVALAGVYVYWRIRRRRRARMISLVALVREPVTFDPAVLATVAGKVWNADLGDGASEGADGFVAGFEMMNTIMHDGRIFLINSFPQPYVEEPEEIAKGMPDLRIARCSSNILHGFLAMPWGSMGRRLTKRSPIGIAVSESCLRSCWTTTVC